MPAVPLPFVVALLLGIMLVRLLRQDSAQANRWALAMVAGYAAQAVVLGLRWGYGLVAVQPLQAVLAAAVPPLSWLGFHGFVAPARRPWPHALPPILVAALWVAAPDAIDPVLELVFLGYGTALLRLAARGPDALARASLGGALPVARALWVTGTMMIASAAIDFAIALALARHDRPLAALISGFASLVSVILLGWAAVIAGESPPAPEAAPEPPPASEPPPPAPPDADDVALVARLDALMRERGLHHDPALSLDRLARRLALPSRRLSAAINRVRGVNVSQYVNAHRIADAQRLLAETDAPVTRILLDVGFQTKSNFNREFLRIASMSPSEWRRQATGSAAPPASG